MKKPFKFLSVCSGIEAASVAWKPLGWEAVAFSEIEAFPASVLKHHYPSVPNHGDMTLFNQWPDYAIDLLVGGTPCQSFSVAGLRKGLDDPRGNLCLTFLAMARRYRPRWLVWENVPGVHSSWTDAEVRPPSEGCGEAVDAARRDLESLGLDPDAARSLGSFEEAEQSSDFDGFLAALVELGYGFTTRVLDAQFFGVAQRRRRVFVVAHLGALQPSQAVLFEPSSLRWDSPPSRSQGERPAGTLTRGALDGSSPSGGDGRDGLLVAGEPGGGPGRAGEPISHEVAPTLTGRGADSPGQGSRDELICAGTIQARGFTGRDVEQGLLVPVKEPLAFNWQIGQGMTVDKELTGTLIKNQTQAVAFDETQITNPDNRSNPQPGDPSHPLTAAGRPPAIAIQERAESVNLKAGPGGTGVSEDLAFTMEARKRPQAVAAEPPQAFKPSHFTCGKDGAPDEVCPPLTADADKGDQEPIVFEPRRFTRGEGPPPGQIAPTLKAGGDKTDGSPVLCVDMGGGKGQANVSEEQSPTLNTSAAGHAIGGGGMVVRRLTPVECERLQGFPDNYTLIPGTDNRRAGEDLEETILYLMDHGVSRAEAEQLAHSPDGPRYKALGNSMATTVMNWLGVRIDAIHQALPWEPPASTL